MKLFPGAAACAVLFLYAAPITAIADSASTEELKALRKSVDEIKASQAEMKKQIQELKNQPKPTAAQLPASSPTPKPPPVSFVNNVHYDFKAEDRTTGSKNVKVIVLEFSDLQCAFCSYYHTHM